jgi:hypothetical protein
VWYALVGLLVVLEFLLLVGSWNNFWWGWDFFWLSSASRHLDIQKCMY